MTQQHRPTRRTLFRRLGKVYFGRQESSEARSERNWEEAGTLREELIIPESPGPRLPNPQNSGKKPCCLDKQASAGFDDSTCPYSIDRTRRRRLFPTNLYPRAMELYECRPSRSHAIVKTGEHKVQSRHAQMMLFTFYAAPLKMNNKEGAHNNFQ